LELGYRKRRKEVKLINHECDQLRSAVKSGINGGD
jgi:hypothetical protein